MVHSAGVRETGSTFVSLRCRHLVLFAFFVSCFVTRGMSTVDTLWTTEIRHCVIVLRKPRRASDRPVRPRAARIYIQLVNDVVQCLDHFLDPREVTDTITSTLSVTLLTCVRIGDTSDSRWKNTNNIEHEDTTFERRHIFK